MNVFEAARSISAIEAAEKLGLRMKTAGQRCVMRCPFHDDKTPSFVLYPGKGGFYCFGCHRHGDAIALYQQALGLNPMEAAKRICADFQLHYQGGSRPSRAPKPDARVLRQKLLAFREAKAKALVEKRTDAQQRMIAREEAMYREGLPFDAWWDDPEWSQAKKDEVNAQEALERLDTLQVRELWQMWQETNHNNKEVNNGKTR